MLIHQKLLQHFSSLSPHQLWWCHLLLSCYCYVPWYMQFHNMTSLGEWVSVYKTKQKNRKREHLLFLNVYWNDNQIIYISRQGSKKNYVRTPRILAKWLKQVGNINLVKWTPANLTHFSTRLVLYRFQFYEFVSGIRLQSCQYSYKYTTLPRYTFFNTI